MTGLVLLACTGLDWTAPPRLAAALNRRGVAVTAVAPAGADLLLSRHVTHRVPFDPTLPESEWRRAVESAFAHGELQLVLAGDDLAYKSLVWLSTVVPPDSVAGRVLQRDLPSPERRRASLSETVFLAESIKAGLRCPVTAFRPPVHALATVATRTGWPLVFKQDGGWSGHGVHVSHDLDDAVAHGHTLAGRDHVVQQHIRGFTGHVVVASQRGRVVAAVGFEKVCLAWPNGPSTVLKRLDHPEMIAMATDAVQRCELTGLSGVDFIVDAEGVPWLLEINPRVVPAASLCERVGVDVLGPLLSAAGMTVPPLPQSRLETVAPSVTLFPGEWMRDPASPYLHSGWHDVPWDDPLVLKAIIDRAGA